MPAFDGNWTANWRCWSTPVSERDEMLRSQLPLACSGRSGRMASEAKLWTCRFLAEHGTIRSKRALIKSAQKSSS